MVFPAAVLRLGKGALFEKVRYFVIFYIKSIKYNKISYFLDYIYIYIYIYIYDSTMILCEIDIFKRLIN